MPTVDDSASLERQRREILARCELLAPLPETSLRVLALLDDPDTEAKDLRRLIELDAVLAARLLTVANSAWLGVRRLVTTIEAAVLLVGFSGVRSLVLAASLQKPLCRDAQIYGHGPRGLWEHSLAVATGARFLGRCARQDRRVQEELFVAGLLHDLGRWVLTSFLEERTADEQRPVAPEPEAERRILGVDHTEAGALIAAKFGLGERVQELIEHHHDDPAAQGSELVAWLAPLRLAQGLSNELGIGYEAGRAPSAVIHDSDLAALGLSEAEWQAAKVEAIQAIDLALADLSGID